MTARDKKMLMVLGVLAVLVLFYYAVYRPLDKKQTALESEISTLQAELNVLDLEYIKKDKYLAEIEEAKVQIVELEKELPSDLDQERAFKLMFDIEAAFEQLYFGNVNFSELETLNYSNEANDETTELAIRRNIQSQLSMDYSTLKNMLRFVYNYPTRTVVSGIAMNIDEETGLINTTMTLNQYGLYNASRPYEPVQLEKVPTGNPTLFKAANGQAVTEQSNNTSDQVEDVFIIVNPTTSDDFAQIIGLGKDVVQSSYVKTDENAVVNATVTISKSGDAYSASYTMNGVSSGSRVFVADDQLEIRIYSSNRLGNEDLSGMNLTVVNTADKPVYVSFENEDANNPRVTVVGTEGDVVIK